MGNSTPYDAARGIGLLPMSSTDRRNDFALSKMLERGRVLVRRVAMRRMQDNSFNGAWGDGADARSVGTLAQRG